MKLMIATSVALVVLVCGAALFAFQRTADWGFTGDQGNNRAEFYWSRLSYASRMGSYGGYGFGGFGRGGSWFARLP